VIWGRSWVTGPASWNRSMASIEAAEGARIHYRVSGPAGDGLASALLEGDDREDQVTRPGRVVEEAVPLGQDVIDVG
jgi:hypothetical protein